MPPQSDIENLPDDLKEIVIDDNKRFAQEIVDWDEAQSRNTISPSGGSISSGGGDGDVKQERTSAKSNYL